MQPCRVALPYNLPYTLSPPALPYPHPVVLCLTPGHTRCLSVISHRISYPKVKNAKAAKTLNSTTYQTTLTKLKV